MPTAVSMLRSTTKAARKSPMTDGRANRSCIGVRKRRVPQRRRSNHFEPGRPHRPASTLDTSRPASPTPGITRVEPRPFKSCSPPSRLVLVEWRAHRAVWCWSNPSVRAETFAPRRPFCAVSSRVEAVCSASNRLLRRRTVCSAIDPSAPSRAICSASGLIVRVNQHDEHRAALEFFELRSVILYTYPPS